MCKQAICPICKKPFGDEMPGAKVYHLTCLIKDLQPMRERDKR